MSFLSAEHRYVLSHLTAEHQYIMSLLSAKHRYIMSLLAAEHRYIMSLLTAEHRYIMSLLAAEPHITTGLLFPSQYLCGSHADPVFDGVGLVGFKSRANAFIYWPQLLIPFCLPLFIFSLLSMDW